MRSDNLKGHMKARHTDLTLKFLPEKVEDERTRLEHVMTNFSPSNRNEAVSLLDNLKRRGISPDAYKHYNTILAESLSLSPPTVKRL